MNTTEQTVKADEQKKVFLPWKELGERVYGIKRPEGFESIPYREAVRTCTCCNQKFALVTIVGDKKLNELDPKTGKPKAYWNTCLPCKAGARLSPGVREAAIKAGLL